MIRWLFLFLFCASLLYSEDVKEYLHVIVDRTVSSLGGEGLLTYKEETWCLDDAGRIEEVTLHMGVRHSIDPLTARELLHGIHGVLLRNVNIAADGEEYFAEFPVCEERIGVRLYCGAPGSSDPAQQLLGGLLQRMILRSVGGHI